MFSGFDSVPNFKGTILYDYYCPTANRRIDVSDIEYELFHPESNSSSRIDKFLLDTLNQSNVLDYVRLVNAVSKETKTMVCTVLMRLLFSSSIRIT